MIRRNRIAFIHSGSFAHINERVAELLREHFPEFAVDDIDLRRDILPRHDTATFLGALGEYWADILLGRRKLRDSALQLHSTHFFQAARAAVQRQLRRRPYAFSLQTQSLFDGSLPGIPHFVYTDHTHLANLRYPGFDPRRLASPEWIALERQIYRNATAVFVTSRFAERSLLEDYQCDPQQIHCIYSGGNVEVERAPGDKRYQDQHILFIGRQWERKGGPQLAAAFRQLLPLHPQAQLTIVGCRPQLDLPSCHAVGAVPLEEVRRYYEAATLLCLPSVIEPSASVLIEAAAHGLAVVATDVGGSAERALHGRTGFLVPPGDEAALAISLERLLTDTALRRSFGQEGYWHVLRNFRWSRVGSRMRARIGQALAESGKQSLRALPRPRHRRSPPRARPAF